MNEDYVVSDEMSSPEAIDAVEHNIGRDMKNTGRPSELQLEAIDQPGINQQQTPIDSVVKKDNPDSDKAKLDIAPSRNHQPQNVVSEITGKESNPSKPFQESNEPDGKAAVYFWTVFAGIFIALFVTGYFVLSRMDKGLDVKQKTTDTLLKRNQILDQTAEDVNPDLGQVIEEQEVNYAEIIRSEEGVTIVVNEAENIVTEDTDSQAEVEGLMNSETNEIKISSRLLEVEVEVEVETEKEIVSREIVHVVVKGDTLWHIAKRYIKNPYHYPQLARLSKIKNPDLIYPGDKVRIIMNNQRE